MTTVTIPRTQHQYQPRGACARAIECRLPELLVSGPAGTGKSRALLEKVHMLALLHPGMQALLVRKVRDTLSGSILKTWREFVIPEAKAAGICEFYGGSAEEPPQYRYNNGSTVVLAGMDKASKQLSTEYDIIYVNEAVELTEHDWEVLLGRLRHWVIGFQQIIADTNPSLPTHWLKQRCDRGQTQMFESRHEDNPQLYELVDLGDGDEVFQLTEKGREYIAKLDAMTGVTKERLRHGRWVAAEGIIYEEWDPAIHVIEAMPEGWEEWPRYMSIDWGFTNPMVVQWWAEDSDGRLYLYRELYQTGLLASEAGEVVKAIVADNGERIIRAVADHDAGDREAFRKASGIRTYPAKKDVTVGLQTVADRLKVAKDGQPRLYLVKGALLSRDSSLTEQGKPCCTEEEVPGYVWDQHTASGREKEKPLKENDHGCDAKRYMCMERRRRTRTHVGVV